MKTIPGHEHELAILTYYENNKKLAYVDYLKLKWRKDIWMKIILL